MKLAASRPLRYILLCILGWQISAVSNSAASVDAITATIPEAGLIQIEMSPAPFFHSYGEVVVLPFVGGDQHAVHLFSQWIEELDRTMKYQLLPLMDSSGWPATGSESGPTDLRNAALAIARARGVHGVIAGALTTSPAPRLDIGLHDTRTKAPVWSMTLSLPPADPTAGDSLAQMPELLVRGAHELLRHLVGRGDIFTSRLPAPRVLVTKGWGRNVRIIIEPEPDGIFAAYQLLRAQDSEGPFIPVGSPPVQGDSPATPLILDDDTPGEATPSYYTVIGLTDDGLANIPALPFAAPPPSRPEESTEDYSRLHLHPEPDSTTRL